MCCYYVKKATERLRKLMLENGGEMTFWKCYRHEGDTLVGVCQFNIISEAGVVASDRKNCRPSLDSSDVGSSIGCGIHVGVTEVSARSWVMGGTDFIVVPVQCLASDLVAADHGQRWRDEPVPSAVFMKVRILKADFDKAVGK